MPATTVYLVRHGEAEATAASADPGLSELGRKQAKAVGVRLSRIDFTLLHHSSRRRAVETADIVAERLTTTRVLASAWAEDLTPFPADWNLVPDRYHGLLRDVPEDERDLGASRLEEAIAEFSRVGDDDQSVLVITHNFVVGWFVRHALDAPWWRWIGLNQVNGGVSIISWENDLPPRLIAFNDASHLPEQ